MRNFAVFTPLCNSCRPIRFYGQISSKRISYYDVLGIKPTADFVQIRSAFIDLLKTHHPDKRQHDDTKAHAHCIEINEAYSVLSKSSTRYDYDISMGYRRSPACYESPSFSRRPGFDTQPFTPAEFYSHHAWTNNRFHADEKSKYSNWDAVEDQSVLRILGFVYGVAPLVGIFFFFISIALGAKPRWPATAKMECHSKGLVYAYNASQDAASNNVSHNLDSIFS